MQRQLRSKDSTINSLQQEVDTVLRDQVMALSLLINQDADRISPETQSEWLAGGLSQEIVKALRVHPERIEVIGMHTGQQSAHHREPPLVVDLSILPPSSEQEGSASDLYKEFSKQVSSADSRLRNTESLRFVESVSVKAPRDWIDRLRATVFALQEERDALTQDVRQMQANIITLRTHTKERGEDVGERNKALEKQVEELSRKLSVTQEARVLQSESLNLQKETEMTKMKVRVDTLTEQVGF